MLLAINANNTNTVFAVWDGVSLTGVWRAATDGRRTADEYVVWLDHLLGLQNLSRRQIDGAVIASVVPEANFNLRRLCREYCRRDPLVVGAPGVAIGAQSLVDRPEEVGADRPVHTLPAHAMAAPKLPSVPIARTEKVIGTSTVACMQSGIFWGYVGLVEGLVDRIKREFGSPMDVVSTGGLAPLFDGVTPIINRIDPDLTLWGLRLIYQQNSSK